MYQQGIFNVSLLNMDNDLIKFLYYFRVFMIFAGILAGLILFFIDWKIGLCVFFISNGHEMKTFDLQKYIFKLKYGGKKL